MALIAAYAFDEGAGTTAGEVSGGTTLTGIPGWSGGRHGSGLRLNQQIGPVASPYATDVAFTAMMDVYIAGAPTNGYHVLLNDDPGGGGVFGNLQMTAGGVLEWYPTIGGVTTIAAGAWAHVAVTADGTTRTLVVNGVSVGTASHAARSGSAPLTIGGQTGYLPNLIIDNVRFYNSALTVSEIAALAGTAVTSGAGPAFDATVFDAGSFYTPAAAGTDNPVSGVVAGTSTSSGSLAGRLALVGAVAATSALVGSIGVSQGLSGTVAATSSTPGAVSAQHPLGGTVEATSTTTGSPVADHPVAGLSAATTAVTGAPSSTQGLAGAAAGMSATTGTIGLRAPLAGTTAATSTTSGAPSSRQALTGTTAATSTTAGTFFEAGPQNYPLTGTVAATTSTSGTVTARHPLGGTVAAVSSAAGAVVRAAALAGAVESTSVTFGDVTASLVLTGTVDSVSATAGEFVPPVTQFQGRILSASLAIPTAAGSIAVPSATGDVVTHRVSARLSILRARGVLG